MDAMRVTKILEKDGDISIQGLPFKRGQVLEIIFLTNDGTPDDHEPLTGKKLLESGLIGLWKDREDITDSAVFARELREEAQSRSV